jgi:hypothetical protein
MSKEAMKLALEALRKSMQGNLVFDEAMEAFKALEEALTLEQEQLGEPAAIVDSTISGHLDWLCTVFPKQGTKLYTTPPQSKARGLSQQQRKPLTDEQIERAENQIWNTYQLDEVERQANKEFVRAIEAAHGIKE